MLKIKAFTLIEMMITISLSALILVLVFKAYSNAKIMAVRVKESFDSNEDKAAFISTFQNDMYNSEFIAHKNGTYIFEKSKESIRYRFYPEFVIRNSSRSDSFIISGLSILYEADSSDLINVISVNLIRNEDSLEYSFNKNYSCFDRLNWAKHKR